MEIKPLDSGLWSGLWRVVTGCRSSDIRPLSNETGFVVVFGDICEKNSGAHGTIMCRSNTSTPKKIRGNIDPSLPFPTMNSPLSVRTLYRVPYHVLSLFYILLLLSSQRSTFGER